MKLKTDFRCYYDWAFDGQGEEFVRVATNAGPNKQEQFRILKDAGFKTPPFGTFEHLTENRWWDEGYIKFVVAYTDTKAHVGEGKELWSLSRAKNLVGGLMNPDLNQYFKIMETFCSAYVDGPHGVSWRRLQVGPHVFWIEYTSNSDWRSNCGEGDIELLEYKLNEGYHPHIRLPLFAIDFVHGKKDMYAVDFNIAPGIRGSGAEKVLKPDHAVQAIEEAYRHFKA